LRRASTSVGTNILSDQFAILGYSRRRVADEVCRLDEWAKGSDARYVPGDQPVRKLPNLGRSHTSGRPHRE
jgi:hypothetical protein